MGQVVSIDPIRLLEQLNLYVWELTHHKLVFGFQSDNGQDSDMKKTSCLPLIALGHTQVFN